MVPQLAQRQSAVMELIALVSTTKAPVHIMEEFQAGFDFLRAHGTSASNGLRSDSSANIWV
jgi:hypothetical protein